MHAFVHAWSLAEASLSGTAEARPRRGPSRAAYEGTACVEWRLDTDTGTRETQPGCNLVHLPGCRLILRARSGR